MAALQHGHDGTHLTGGRLRSHCRPIRNSASACFPDAEQLLINVRGKCDVDNSRPRLIVILRAGDLIFYRGQRSGLFGHAGHFDC